MKSKKVGFIKYEETPLSIMDHMGVTLYGEHIILNALSFSCVGLCSSNIHTFGIKLVSLQGVNIHY
jgi:hypothetical protein